MNNLQIYIYIKNVGALNLTPLLLKSGHKKRIQDHGETVAIILFNLRDEISSD